MADRFEGAGLGEELEVLGEKFQIVGIFEAGQGVAESEIWTDLEVLGQASKRTGYLSSVQARATSASAAKGHRRTAGPGRTVFAQGLHRAGVLCRTGRRHRMLKVVGQIIAFFLTVGAMFAVANTMFGAVASRAREIGTLRAIGFSRRTVLISFLVESLLLCLAGGVLGILGTLPLNGMSTGTANWSTFSELHLLVPLQRGRARAGVRAGFGDGTAGRLVPGDPRDADEDRGCLARDLTLSVTPYLWRRPARTATLPQRLSCNWARGQG